MPELSSEAKIGKILILVGFILGIFGTIFSIIFGIILIAFSNSEFAQKSGLSLFGGFYLVWGILMIVGTILAIFAYKSASNHDFHKAGIMGIVASLIPPLNIFILIGGILCLTSREAKERHHY